MKPNRNRTRDLGFYALLIVLLIAVIFTMSRDTESNTVEDYSELIDLFESEKVQYFRTEGSTYGNNRRSPWWRPAVIIISVISESSAVQEPGGGAQKPLRWKATSSMADWSARSSVITTRTLPSCSLAPPQNQG